MFAPQGVVGGVHLRRIASCLVEGRHSRQHDTLLRYADLDRLGDQYVHAEVALVAMQQQQPPNVLLQNLLTFSSRAGTQG